MGFWELLVIGLIALIVVGPERLPALARSLGRLWAQLSRSLQNLQRDLGAMDQPRQQWHEHLKQLTQQQSKKESEANRGQDGQRPKSD